MIGKTWFPDNLVQDGTLATDMKGMAEGCIRVQKTCGQCGKVFEGWEFIASLLRHGELMPGSLDIGTVKACDDCIEKWEAARAVADLNQRLERVQRNWEDAREARKKLAPGREMLRVLKQLIAVVPFASPTYLKHERQRDAISQWIAQHEETL